MTEHSREWQINNIVTYSLKKKLEELGVSREELAVLGSPRVNKAIKEIESLDNKLSQIDERCAQWDGQQQEGVNIIPPEEYEKLGENIAREEEKVFPLDKKRKKLFQDLEKLIDYNSTRIYRRRADAEEKRKQEEIGKLLDDLRGLTIIYGIPLLVTKRKLFGKERFLLQKLREYDPLGADLLHASSNSEKRKPYQQFRNDLKEIWKQKTYEFKIVLAETKVNGDWKKEFEEVFRKDSNYDGEVPCDHLDLDVKLEDDGSWMDYKFTCSLRGGNCVAHTYDLVRPIKNSYFKWCPGYNLPKDLAETFKELWRKEKKK